jgi:hypothetical protein
VDWLEQVELLEAQGREAVVVEVVHLLLEMRLGKTVQMVELVEHQVLQVETRQLLQLQLLERVDPVAEVEAEAEQ